MPGRDVDIHITGGEHLERIVKALLEVGDGGLARELKSELRKAARPMVPKVRAAIMQQIPSQHDGSLRRAMAAATRSQFRAAGTQAGITIKVDGSKMPDGKKALPSYMEGRKRPWKHPVYGNRNVWVRQADHQYFFKTVEPMGADVKKNMDAIAQRIAKKLEG